MLVSELITRAYYYSGIVQREGNTPSDTQSVDGLNELNSVLRKFSIDGNGIPYTTHATKPLVQGQESYVIDGLVKIQAITYTYDAGGSIRYGLRQDTINNYFGSTRPENIQALPYHYYPEKVNGGMELWFYFLPFAGMTLNITGVYMLAKADFGTELDDTLDGFFQDYLMFLTSARLCVFNRKPVPVYVADELRSYQTKIDAINPPDLSVQTMGLFNSNNIFDAYVQANFMRGWGP